MKKYKIIQEKFKENDHIDFFGIYKRTFFFFWSYVGYSTTLEGAKQRALRENEKVWYI